eukprot:CAMPEP_0114520194 /NCGR_PEP_ID=MMETSP0109-20121206/19434_1 /TAXON_ID=29199 /ORGANISM="Chlorarachnion reptans, Strain CCCM449" /LENGTH=113 /DNA_ID=CAMNT_0001701039 /DNA_START=116 /DNA_END=457 /DNA_ORIENTATION=+
MTDSTSGRDYRFYAAQAAAAGLLISAVKFPFGENRFASVVSHFELASVVMLMNHVPGAGLLGAVSGIAGAFITVENDQKIAKISSINKIILLGTSSLLCVGLFLDKRGLKLLN